MTKRLEGKVAIITGGASGIGEACVRLFLREGAQVLFGDIQLELGMKLTDSLRAEGYAPSFAPLDVTDESAWTRAVQQATSLFGPVTSLVNNAGIASANGLERGTREEWDRIIAINQTGTWLGMRAVMPEMVRKGSGSIVNVSSVYGLIGASGFTAYTASKAAVRLMSKSVAVEYGSKGIRCNSLHPGPTLTPLAKTMLTAADIQKYEQAIPLRMMGNPEDIAYGALYLCSDEARFVTGTELIVDGGRSCGW